MNTITRSLVGALLPILEAFADGKKIQVAGLKPETDWVDAGEQDVSLIFSTDHVKWRIKPERIAPIEFWIAYRPYKPYPQILERIFVAEENKDNSYWPENGFKVRKFVEVVE